MKIQKEKNGITLIALVVTIVVLLILAGISINLVLGDNGIVNRTKDAKEKTEYAQEKERVQYAVIDALDWETTTVQTEKLKEALKNEFNLSDTEINNRLETKSDNGPWIYNGDKGKHEIDENGSISKKLESGLYDLDDNQIYDWNELLKKGYITVTDGVLTTGYKYSKNPNENNLVGKLVIDDSVTEIGEEGLGGLTKLEKIVLTEGIILNTDAMENTGIRSIGPKGSGASVELPRSIKEIPSYTFEKCEKLTYGVLNDNIDKINRYAFSRCENLEIQVSSNIKNISDYSFNNVKVVCYTGEISTKYWGSYNIHKFDTTGTCEICKYHKDIELSGTEITLNNENAYIVGYQKNITEDLNIPEKVEINGKEYTIVGIANSTFKSDKKIKKVTIPNTVMTIGGWVLSDCEQLEEVYISENTTDIKNGFLYSCSNLKRIDIADNNPRYMDIDGVCYSKDGKILIVYPSGKDCTNFSIPNAVEELGNICFTETNINNIEISSQIKKFGEKIFANCTSLKSVIFNASVEEIPRGLCIGCKNLEKFTMTDSIRVIKNSVFEDCYNLQNVKLSNNIEKIEGWAFSSCYNLKSITLPASLSEIGWCTFENTGMNINFQNYLNLKVVGNNSLPGCSVANDTIKQYILSINSTAFDWFQGGTASISQGYTFEI